MFNALKEKRDLVKVNVENCANFVSFNDVQSFFPAVAFANEALENKSGLGKDYLGWMTLPSEISEDLIDQIQFAAEKMAEKSEVIVVIGIGGSYLGARAVIDALSDNFHYLRKNRVTPVMVYAGNNIGEDYHYDLLKALDKYDYSVIVISKSGTTTEPAIAFRLLKNHLESKYSVPDARSRIIAITDKNKGALRKVATNEGYKTFVIPDDVGGRYSVLTPVGLMPIAAAGINIREIIKGAIEMENFLSAQKDLFANPANLYAATRNALYRKGQFIEILATYTPSMQYFIEWWKQLFGESEGKEHKGIYPAGVTLTTDLHSMGQLIQEGARNIFETVIKVGTSNSTLLIPESPDNADELNYLAGKKMSYVNEKAMEGTLMAHVDGGVPNIVVSIPELNPRYLGQLIYFFEKACAVSGYLLGVNPFNQPGVEAYKKNMFKLLGKK
ncbi:MAG: glucose-6-phosphate isomerase [Bacteroidetes bacterium]|nr:glucose-6-phosphate isomerase [Bacteroidota bacterium]